MTRIIVDIPPEKMNAAIHALLQKGIVHDENMISCTSDFFNGLSYYILHHCYQQDDQKQSSYTFYYCFSDWDIFCNELEFE